MRALLVSMALLVAACGKSEPDSGNPVKKDLERAGENLKSAATHLAEEAKPGYERARDVTRDAIHDAAEKVSDWTTRPATAPK